MIQPQISCKRRCYEFHGCPRSVECGPSLARAESSSMDELLALLGGPAVLISALVGVTLAMLFHSLAPAGTDTVRAGAWLVGVSVAAGLLWRWIFRTPTKLLSHASPGLALTRRPSGDRLRLRLASGVKPLLSCVLWELPQTSRAACLRSWPIHRVSSATATMQQWTLVLLTSRKLRPRCSR